MMMIKPVDGSFILKFLIIAFFLIVFSLIQMASLLFVITLVFWLFLLMLSLNSFNDNISLFCFLVSFFVFLLGREICFTLFNVDLSYDWYQYLTVYNDFAFFCLFISLLCIGIGYYFPFNRGNKKRKNQNIELIDKNILEIRPFLKKVYFFCYVFFMIKLVVKIVSVRTVGYLGSYVFVEQQGGISALISYIGAFCPTVFFLYLGTKPTKADAFYPIITFEIYGVLSLLSGVRFTFVGVSMLLLMYLVIRNREEDGWITKRMKIIVLSSIPFMLFFLGAYDVIRLGKTYDFSSVTDPLFRFFDGQGGSINMIKRVKYYEDSLIDLGICSLNQLYTLLFNNFIVRSITGSVVFGGNTLEHALQGHSLAHRLSWYEYGSAYLAGRGVGSCYIAELYHDFGYLGICIGNLFYGYLLRLVGSINNGNNFFKNGVLLVIMYSLLHAPRSSFDEFVYNIFGIYLLIGYALIFFVWRFHVKIRI